MPNAAAASAALALGKTEMGGIRTSEGGTKGHAPRSAHTDAVSHAVRYASVLRFFKNKQRFGKKHGSL